MYKSLALGIVLLHAIVWTLIPYNTLHTVGLDSVEMIAWGRALDLGYFKHPPMPSWVAIGIEHILPTNMAVFASSQLCIALTAWGVWILAQSFVSKSSALVATIFTLILPHTTWISPEWNHDLVQLPFWVWTIVAFNWICISRGNNIGAWAFMAIVSALGLYGKYSMGILYVSILLYAVLWHRHILKIQGIFIFCVLFFAILTPHVLWLYSVDFSPFTYAQDRLQGASMLNRIGSFWGALFANLLFVFIGILITIQKAKFRFLSVPLGHFLVYITWMPLILLTIMVFVLNISVHSRWNFPFLSVIPLMLLWWWEKHGYSISVLRACVWVVLISGFVAGYYKYYYTNTFNRGHYPAAEIAKKIEDIWVENMQSPLVYVAGNQWSAGTIAVYAPNTPKLIIDNNMTINGSIDFDDVKKHGYMYIWRQDETPNISNFIATGTVSAPYHVPFENSILTLNWGIVKL